jgi:hypothetical protein
MSNRTTPKPTRRWARRLVGLAITAAAVTGALATTAGPAHAGTECGFYADVFACIVDNGGGDRTYANSRGEIIHNF